MALTYPLVADRINLALDPVFEVSVGKANPVAGTFGYFWMSPPPAVTHPSRFVPYKVASFDTADGEIAIVLDRPSVEHLCLYSAYAMGAMSYDRGFWGRVVTWMLEAILSRRIVDPKARLPRLSRVFKPVKFR